MGVFHREIITFGLGLCVLLSVPHKVCTAQGVTNSESPKRGVVLTKFVQPIYPPVARATRTTGDVDLLVTIRRDGAVDSVVVLSGHPLLKESAVISAQQSQFECRGCTEQQQLTKYRLVYTFEIEGACECEPKETQSNKKEPEQAYPRISDAQHRVTVVAQILCICDPAATITRRVRSLKCLYLWKCGQHSQKVGLAPD